MQAVIEQRLITDSAVEKAPDFSGTKIGFLTRLFGCQHRRLTRPIADGKAAFMSCLECGARREFDTENFTASGPFHYPPTVNVRP
jgi:hypothetical protein